MNALFEYLATLADQPLGTVVHIGAGNGRDLESYDALKPNRLVLVEGDSDAATELQRHVAHWPWAEVHARPVAAQAGPLAWNRYTLPGLNGPLQTGALSAFYPRLRLFESRTLDALALPELLAGLSIECDEARVNVLVLDVPGQEGSLLASLPLEQIVKFGFVLLRGVREALLPWGCTSAQAVDQLCAACFDVVAGAVEHEPLWPVALLRFNAQRYQAEQLEQRLQSMHAALEASDKLAAERAAQIEQLTQAKAAVDKTAAVRAAQVQQLTQARDEQAKLAADRQAQLESLTQAKAAADKTAAERAAQFEQLNLAKAAVEKTAADRAAQIQQLTQARDEQAKLAGEQTKLAAERAAQIQQLTQSHDEQAKLAGEQTKLAVDRQAQLESLTQAKAAADNTSAERAAQIEQLNQAKVAVEKTAAERAAQIAALSEKSDALTRERDQALGRAHTAANQLESLKASSDALQSQLVSAKAETLAAKADAAAAQADVSRAEQGSRSRIAELEDEIAQLRLRQRLLDEEMIKAEGQIELIKDVLLREPSL